MNIKALRLAAVTGVAIACLLTAEDASAQSVQYYYPMPNYNWNQQVVQPNYQVVQPSTQYYYSAPRTTSYRRTPQPLTGYGANLHRNFTIKQELLRTQRTGQPVRNRGNLRWIR